jgi:dihydrofolate synthase/folylpolyglutamate synthase
MIQRIRFSLCLKRSGVLKIYTSGLAGNYQHENLATVLSSLSYLGTVGWKLTEAAVNTGLLSVVENTGIMGRWQTVGSNPRSICDTAHNQAGIASVIDQVKQTPWKSLHIVWGMVNDKDLDSILPLLPREAFYYFTRSSVPRSLDPGALREAANAHGLKGKVYESVVEAYSAANEFAGKDDMIFTGGSTFVVADLLESIG